MSRNKFFGDFNTPLKSILIPAIYHIVLVGVPIFLMISGALLLNRQYRLSDFLKRRFTRIIYPFIFWMSIILIIGFFHFHWSYNHIWKVFTGNPSIAWYFWTLIGIYLFIPVINSFLKEYGLKALEYFLIIWFLTIILKSINSYPIFPDFNLDYFAGFIGYPILGYYLDNKEFKIDDSKVCIISLIILLVSWIVYSLLSYYQIPVLEPLYQNVPIVFMASGLFLFIKYLDKLNRFKTLSHRILGKIIESISICSYGMYYAHFLIISALLPLKIHSFKLSVPIIFIIIFFSWTLTFIFSKIPYLNKFSGV